MHLVSFSRASSVTSLESEKMRRVEEFRQQAAARHIQREWRQHRSREQNINEVRHRFDVDVGSAWQRRDIGVLFIFHFLCIQIIREGFAMIMLSKHSELCSCFSSKQVNLNKLFCLPHRSNPFDRLSNHILAIHEK